MVNMVSKPLKKGRNCIRVFHVWTKHPNFCIKGNSKHNCLFFPNPEQYLNPPLQLHYFAFYKNDE